jgi:hypothetical protein
MRVRRASTRIARAASAAHARSAMLTSRPYVDFQTRSLSAIRLRTLLREPVTPSPGPIATSQSLSKGSLLRVTGILTDHARGLSISPGQSASSLSAPQGHVHHGPTKYGRIISLSSCSTMWQCQTYSPGMSNRALTVVISPG